MASNKEYYPPGGLEKPGQAHYSSHQSHQAQHMPQPQPYYPNQQGQYPQHYPQHYPNQQTQPQPQPQMVYVQQQPQTTSDPCCMPCAWYATVLFNLQCDMVCLLFLIAISLFLSGFLQCLPHRTFPHTMCLRISCHCETVSQAVVRRCFVAHALFAVRSFGRSFEFSFRNRFRFHDICIVYLYL
ncbi:hypothetical protein BDZ97DRAFT_1798544, partial [Flammula alnicola]